MNPNNLETATIPTVGGAGGGGRGFYSNNMSQRWTIAAPAPQVAAYHTLMDEERMLVEQEQVRQMSELLQAARRTGIGRAVNPFDLEDNNEQLMSDVEETLKVRHLTKYEREGLHQPARDWKETPKGDVCKNACTLEVEDILSKHKLQ